MKYMLDLCAGLGGASEAFHLDPNWEVIRIDNNPLLEDVDNMIIDDIFETNVDVPHCKFDYIHASPPCLEFSTAYSAPKSAAARSKKQFSPDLSIVKRCVQIIEWHKPKHWSIENVLGSIPDLKPVLGNPAFTIGPFVYWGTIPYPHVGPNFKHCKLDGDSWSTDPLRANKRAIIPLEISTAILTAISDQTFLEDWI